IIRCCSPQENVDPSLHLQQERGNQPIEEQKLHRRDLTVNDEQEIWKDITLTHLQRILGVKSLNEVLDQRHVNPQNIIHNMTKVNKHGVVTLEDKTNDLPHWVLSAMKSLANWPKYDSDQPSYPGFERDVFKTVSDYFYSLPQPLLTYELYELFINVLVFCGYITAPSKIQRGKRKKTDLPSVPPPAKSSFRSTECLLLSLLRQGSCDEAESPMGEVLGGKLQSRLDALKGDEAGGSQFGGSCTSLNTAIPSRPQTRSCSLEIILDDSAPLTQQQLFLSSESLTSCSHSNKSQHDSPSTAALESPSDFSDVNDSDPLYEKAPAASVRSRRPVISVSGPQGVQRSRSLRPRSMGSCLDIVMETKEEDVKEMKWQDRASSCLNVSTFASQRYSSSASHSSSLSSYRPSFSSHHLHSSFFSTDAPHAPGPGGSRSTSTTSDSWAVPAPPAVRRCLSSLDVSKAPQTVLLLKPPVCVPARTFQPPQSKPEHSVLQPQCERVAIEALQLCTLLLPPASRRKLQLLMRMASRISQNVDMPRLHPAIGTRTLMVHTFSGCVLSSAEECDLDELLATRLVSFLMDHQQSILSVPEYLLNAINDRIQYLRSVQVPVESVPATDEGDPVCLPMPMYAFCHQISGAEFEQQKQASSQKAMEELLEILLTDQNISEKDRCKKLKQFQKQYPDIYRQRFPSSERQTKGENKPKIKPPLLTIRKTKTFSIRD
ncbi:unnamed protein product, partial [Menidia menidia]